MGQWLFCGAYASQNSRERAKTSLEEKVALLEKKVAVFLLEKKWYFWREKGYKVLFSEFLEISQIVPKIRPFSFPNSQNFEQEQILISDDHRRVNDLLGHPERSLRALRDTL